MKTKVLFFILLLLLVTALLQADKVDDTYKKMTKAYAELTSWQAIINQTNYFAQTKTKLSSSGKFYYKKNQIAIRYSKPNEQVLLIKGGKVTMFYKSSNAVVKSELVSAVQALNPIEIIKLYWDKSNKTIKEKTDTKTAIVLNLKNDNQIKDVSFTLDNKTGLITSFLYTDKQGNTVSMNFTEMKVNKPIPETVWKLVVPKDAIIYER